MLSLLGSTGLLMGLFQEGSISPKKDASLTAFPSVSIMSQVSIGSSRLISIFWNVIQSERTCNFTKELMFQLKHLHVQ